MQQCWESFWVDTAGKGGCYWHWGAGDAAKCCRAQDGSPIRVNRPQVSEVPREERLVLSSVGQSFPPCICTEYLLVPAGGTVGGGWKGPNPSL